MFIRKFIPNFIIKFYHYLLALIGAIIYGFPSNKLVVVGVTGTNGKSTVVNLISKILENAGGSTVASLSSIKFKIGEKEEQNMLKMTMPGRFKLQKFLDQANKNNCQYAVLEVTSEGIKQFRHKFINFDLAVFTNLTKEHIEAHQGLENYKKAKGKLFNSLVQSKTKNINNKKIEKISIVNIDDKHSDYFLQFKPDKTYTYGIENKQAEITPEKIDLKINLPGEFNIYNALAAFCVGISQDIQIQEILEALKDVKIIPGRMEKVITEPFDVIVDYAHTSDSLEKVYKTLKPSTSNMICVLGSCGGGRDKWKRQELGKIAGKYCNKIILTNEDPYDENPSQILSEIKSGISNFQFPIFKILDRREAINKALSIAQKDDLVVITGKGCEPWICVENNKKIPWDDRRVVKEEFEKLYS